MPVVVRRSYPSFQDVTQAMTRVRQGANPNAPLYQLCGRPRPQENPAHPSDEAWSLLHMVVRYGAKDMIQELLEQGATPHVGPDQPVNLIVVVLRLLSEPHHQWRSTGERVDGCIDIINLLAQYGARCDPATIQQERATSFIPDLSEHFSDPFLSLLLAGSVLHEQHVMRLGQTLIDHQADPSFALGAFKDISVLSPEERMRMNVFVRLQALQSHQELTHALQAISNSSPHPPSLKM